MSNIDEMKFGIGMLANSKTIVMYNNLNFKAKNIQYFNWSSMYRSSRILNMNIIDSCLEYKYRFITIGTL